MHVWYSIWLRELDRTAGLDGNDRKWKWTPGFAKIAVSVTCVLSNRCVMYVLDWSIKDLRSDQMTRRVIHPESTYLLEYIHLSYQSFSFSKLIYLFQK